MGDTVTTGPRVAAVEWGWRHLMSGLGILLLVAWLPFYAFISLLGPGWAVVPALAVWLVLLLLALRWFRPHPGRTMLVGVVAIVGWHAVGYLLDAAGWAA